MTTCTQASLRFPGCQGRRVEADFSGGEITGDAGVVLLRQADRVLKLSEAVARTRALASASTLSRWENRSDRAPAWRLHEVLVEPFIGSFHHAPRQLVLDFDATDDRVHGGQQGRFLHGYYDHYCFLPLYVFCGDRVLVSYLRPSKIDPAKHAWAILAPEAPTRVTCCWRRSAGSLPRHYGRLAVLTCGEKSRLSRLNWVVAAF